MSPPSGFHFGRAPTGWFSLSYIREHSGTILSAAAQHLELTILPLAIGCALALPLALLARRGRWARHGVLSAANALYAIPSLAAIVALQPIFGLAIWTVVLPLAGYSLVILVRNVLTGLDEVPPDTVQAARGMGLTRRQLLVRVQLPLALPSIVAGLRVATVSTIELVVIGGYVGQGGFGYYILEGFRNNFYKTEIATYILFTVLLALAADLLVSGVGRLLTPWQRGRLGAPG